MTDEESLYLEGYRDGWRGALATARGNASMKTFSDRAMEAIAEGDYIASINALQPGADFNNDPACFARYCNMQANTHQEFPLIAEDMRQARDIADPTFRSKARAAGRIVDGTKVL